VADPTPDRSDLAAAGVGDLNATFCTTLVDEWARAGVTDAVVCPGSRSTPMAVALAVDERIRVHVHHDERSGSFMALGLGRATGRPAVVLTTSGTAVAELHPAMVEADLDRVPLIAVTADRPPELRDVGAPQTIDQTHLFGRSTRWFADPGPPAADAVWSWRSLAARVVMEATGSPSGPVHLNLPFREPLVGSPLPLPEGRADLRPWHERIETALAPSEEWAELVTRLEGRRGVIVAGAGIERMEHVLGLAGAIGWPVLADPRSGCRVDHPNVVGHADALLRVDGAHRSPDVVVRLGAPPASKVLNQWLASLAPSALQVLVDRDGTWLDPDRTAAVVVSAEPGLFCALLGWLADPEITQLHEIEWGGALPKWAATPQGWVALWRAADDAAEAAIAGTLAGHENVTEPGVARAVAASVPFGGALVVSSSMPVRDLEWFAGSLPGITVHANRGANGIDGVVSTAVGVALAGAPTALLIGDVALLHDTNGLLGLADRGVDLCIVVVHNDGGGIFSFLPQASSLAPERFEQLFGTPHGVDLTTLAVAHGLPVLEALDDESAEVAVRAALAAGGVHLVLVRTDRAANVELHEQLHAATAGAVREALGLSD
jgi:2-succinyl-5-enolpyruvyl-6-hydroxy-3-cyclohexene-1-carboxylate synthase